MARPAGMTPHELAPWGPVEPVRRLTGGHRTEVLEVVVGGRRAVARRSRRSAASLAWELDLVASLAELGFVVPMTIPTLDGRRSVAGIVVQTFVEGHEPESDGDWERVVAELRRLHDVTTGWAQRPGSRTVAELGSGDRSGDADLSAMPADVVEMCRQAWLPLAAQPRSVVHGDPGPGNLRVTTSTVGIIDWDEARVDAGVLDLADVPTRPLPEPIATIAGRAADAWEAANGWQIEPAYARRRLARLRAGGGHR